MLNTSVNFSGVPFSFFYCTKEIHIGFVWTYTAVSLCILLGTPAHCWLLWLSLHAGWKIKPTQVFPLTLIIMDLFFCLHLCVEMLNVFVLQNYPLSCLILFVFGLSWACRVLSQVCICVEQYLAVIYPVTFLRYKAIHYRIAPVAVVLSMSSGYGLFLASAIVEFPDYIYLSICLIGLIVISFCCVSVLRVLKYPGLGGREITRERGRDVGNQQKRNAFKTITAVLLTVLFSYLPLASVSILSLIKLDKVLFECELVPSMGSLNIYCVMVTPLLKLYMEGHLNCINNQNENIRR